MVRSDAGDLICEIVWHILALSIGESNILAEAVPIPVCTHVHMAVDVGRPYANVLRRKMTKLVIGRFYLSETNAHIL